MSVDQRLMEVLSCCCTREAWPLLSSERFGCRATILERGALEEALLLWLREDCPPELFRCRDRDISPLQAVVDGDFWSIRVVEAVLEHHPGATLEQDSLGRTPLHCAQDENVAEVLFSWSPEASYVRADDGGIPLHHLVARGVFLEGMATREACLTKNNQRQYPIDTLLETRVSTDRACEIIKDLVGISRHCLLNEGFQKSRFVDRFMDHFYHDTRHEQSTLFFLVRESPRDDELLSKAMLGRVSEGQCRHLLAFCDRECLRCPTKIGTVDACPVHLALAMGYWALFDELLEMDPGAFTLSIHGKVPAFFEIHDHYLEVPNARVWVLKIPESTIATIARRCSGSLQLLDSKGRNFLHWLCRISSANSERIALVAGMEPGLLRQVDDDGNLPIHILLQGLRDESPSFASTLAMVLDNMLARETCWMLSHENNAGWTPFHIAVDHLIDSEHECMVDVVFKALLDCDPYGMVRLNSRGEPPLFGVQPVYLSEKYLLDGLLAKYPVLFQTQNPHTGEYGLHWLMKHGVWRWTLCVFLEGWPDAAKEATHAGALPLHLYLQSAKTMFARDDSMPYLADMGPRYKYRDRRELNEGLQALVEANPSALTTCPMPFLLAAASDCELDVIYYLLTMNPEALSLAHGSTMDLVDDFPRETNR